MNLSEPKICYGCLPGNGYEFSEQDRLAAIDILTQLYEHFARYGAHYHSLMEAADQDQGSWFLFLPPYSPDFNPIEMALSKLKALVRKEAAGTFEQLWDAVGHVCNLFTDDECFNFIKAAGYETD